MKQKKMTRFLSAALALTMTASMSVPVLAGSRMTYKGTDGTEYVIRWTEGIAEPHMGSEEQESDFRAKQVTIGNTIYEVLEAPYKGSQGWFDFAQEPKEPDPEKEEAQKPFDSGYAAAAANLTYWWLQQNQENLQNYLMAAPKQEKGLADPQKVYDFLMAPAEQLASESPIFNLYKEVFPKEAKPDQLLDFFLNGYAPQDADGNKPEKFSPQEKGGFFYPLLGKNILTQRQEATFENIREAVTRKSGAILELHKDEKIRYVNLWGLETTETGHISALYVTFSADEAGLLRCEVTEGERLQILGMDLTKLYSLELGEEYFMDLEAPNDPPAVPGPEKPQKPESVPKTKWEKTTYAWSSDNQSCIAKRQSAEDPEKTEQEQAKVTSIETQAPTASENGIRTYTATFSSDWADTQVKTEKIPKTDVLWNPTTYAWDETLRICTATRTVQGDPSQKEEVMAAVKDRELTAPTCLKKGQTIYTAEFDVDWAKPQEKILANIPALEPIWGETKYEWSPQHEFCYAERTCLHEADGSHKERIQGNVTREQTRKPTSSRMGETTYTATFNVDWAGTQTLAVEDVPLLTTVWGNPTYQWSEDLLTCTAVRADQNDPEKKETVQGKVTATVTREATCLQKGETTYRAEFSSDWANPQVRKAENIEKLTPDWGEVQYDWSSNHRSCIATRVCRADKGHVETAIADVKWERTIKPTLTSKGETTYTAVFEEDWAKTQKISLMDVPEVKDLWYDPKYQWSEDLTRCTATRVNQYDRELIQTAVGTVSSRKTKAPTHDMKGETTFTAVFKEDWARTQNKIIANIPNIPGNPNGKPEPTKPPQWNAATYEWNEDHSKCTARRSRQNDESNVELAWAEVSQKEMKAPTCAQPGEAVYTAVFKEKWAEKQVLKGEIPTLPHDLEKVPEVAATAAREGLQEHYACKVCGKLFLDSKGTKEVEREQLRLSNPSVAEGYAILNGVPEKDNVIAIAADKFQKSMEENPGSQGVSIAVGSASVTYDAPDIETILKTIGDSQKLQLEICRTDSADTALTISQIQSAERNSQGLLYKVQLSYVKNGKNVPIENLSTAKVMVPYSGEDSVRVYELQEDGAFRELSAERRESFLSFAGDNGIYMLSDQRPAAEVPQKSGSRIGMIIWTAVLIVSGLLCAGLAGFYFYQKKLEGDQELPLEPESFDPVPEVPEEEAASQQMPEFDEKAFDDAALFAEIDKLTADAAQVVQEEKPEPVKSSVSPVAPKAPMQEKPSIAKKTADAVNGKHHKN